ncbi:MAG: hypothetical protein LQ346_001507 [Caloplaca aetnensis]|nr:MAG: hypothetical protein LQ346_001507 [Caloplaca aetnensis]
MDTTAYLTRQGWRGSGHALHPSGNGIKRPLLLSKKNNTLGVGKKVHDAQADQWWSRAFDETLKSINGEKPAKSAGEAPDAAATRSTFHASKWSGSRGLYGRFVRGDGLKGTLGAKEEIIDHGLDHDCLTKKRQLHKSEKSGRKLEGHSVEKRSHQPAKVPQLPRHVYGAIDLFQEGELSTESDPDGVPIVKALSPRLKPRNETKMKKKEKENHEADTTSSVQGAALCDGVQSEASLGRGAYNSTGPIPPLHVIDCISDVTPTSREASERRERKQQRRLEKGAYKTCSISNQNGSEDRAKPQVRKGTKKRKDTKR